MKHTDDFSYSTPDVNGYVPNLNLIGNRYKHTGDGHTYEIISVTWLGASDEWGVSMFRCDDATIPEVTRSVTHLNGFRDNGDRRYINLGVK